MCSLAGTREPLWLSSHFDLLIVLHTVVARTNEEDEVCVVLSGTKNKELNEN